MKRIFCDLCSNEFKYADKPVQHTNQATHTFAKPRTGNEPALQFTVHLDIKAATLTRVEVPRNPRLPYAPSDQYEIKKHHADLCGRCRHELLLRIVGESGDLEITGLQWDATGPDEEPREPPANLHL